MFTSERGAKIFYCKQFINFVVVTLFLCINSQNIYAEQLEVGIIDFPLFYIVADDRSVGGIYVDVINKVLKRASLHYVLVGYPAKRLYKNIINGKTNIWLGSNKTPAYKDNILSSKYNILYVELRVYTVGDEKLPSTKQELKGKDIITIRGYGYGGWITFFNDPENKITLSPSNSHESAFLKLKHGRADYLLDYKVPAEKVFEEVKIEGLQFHTMYKIPILFTVSKKTPNAEKIVRQIDVAIQELVNEGKMIIEGKLSHNQ